MSLQQGISGLNAASRNLEVIGNNIANANTVGAKSSRAEFSDVYANVASNQWPGLASLGITAASPLTIAPTYLGDQGGRSRLLAYRHSARR